MNIPSLNFHHGETIDAHSTREGRTVFWFTLAVAEPAHA